jgi:PAS domain S-box-containing protein
MLARIAGIKGWIYIAVTGLGLYALIHHSTSQIEQSKEEARSSEEKYRQLVENANSIIMRRNIAGNITFFNDFAQDYFGYDREEILGRNVIGTIVPEVDSSGRNLKEMIEDIGKHPERYASNENENMRRNGERVWTAWTNKPIRDEQGQVVEILCIGNDISERKRAEEVLARYELLAAHSRDIILFMQRDDGRILEANAAAVKAYGYSREELLTMTVHQLRTPDSVVMTAGQMDEADTRGILFETVHRRRDGSTFPAEISSRGETIGGVRTLISIVRDITERKQAEEALRAHEEHLRLAMEATRQGWFDINVQTGEVSVSSEYVKIFGYEPADFRTSVREWLDAIHPQDHDAVVKTFQECLEVGDTRTMEYRRQTKTGEWKWVRSIGRIVDFDSNQRPLRMAGTHTDISEHKRVEEALIESQERFRELAELLPETIFETDERQRLTFLNRNALDRFGYSLEDLEPGMSCFELFDREDRPRAMENAGRVMSGDKIGLSEYRALRRDGSSFPVILHCSAKVRDGKSVGLRGIVIDITETKKLEAQLRQAHKMEAVGTLAGGIAHDFNNLLQAVQGYAELLLMKIGKEEGECREIQEISRAAKRGGELIRQLLTFSRKMDPKLQPLDFNGIVDDVRKLLERAIPKMISIELHLGEDLHTVNADAAQMEQVLMNLSVNARDAMPDGGTLTIETRNVILDEEHHRGQPELEPGDYVLLTVSDTGQGIDKATLEHIFDPFFTTKEFGKGTGLGLAMVYGIVKNHHGHITCTSQPGEGTTFEIHLPAFDPPERASAIVKTALELHGNNETLLLVDDDDSVRNSGEQVLRTYGYAVIPASDAEQALQIYRERKDGIDLVILDLIMPGMAGTHCLEKLLEMNPQAKVVIASGYAVNEEIERAATSGARAFIKKPYDVARMLEVVRETLDS